MSDPVPSDLVPSDPVPLRRERVIAHRVAAHGLGTAGGAAIGADGVLDAGLQDYPPTRTAWPALRLRDPAAPERTEEFVVAHTIRAAMHLHRAADLPLLRAGLTLGAGTDLVPQHMGPFSREIEAAGIGLGRAVELVAEAMREVMADGVARTKGELSGAVTGRVDRAVTPWCEGCGVVHVHDATFRYATLQAGLVIEVESASTFRYVSGPRRAGRKPTVDNARVELIRRFLRVSGPATPDRFGTWLGLTPAAVRDWWRDAEPELTTVDVGGRKAWVRTNQLPDYDAAPEPVMVRLVPPYDPFTALADRELAVPDSSVRKQVWRPAGVPGVLLVDGEIAGTWRQRSKADRLTLTVTPFGTLPATRRRAAEADAETIAVCLGAGDVTVEWS